jgi:hypothetical protein
LWKQFTPGIECAGIDVLGTDQVTLVEIEPTNASMPTG